MSFEKTIRRISASSSLRIAVLFLADAFVLYFSYFFAMFLRFDFQFSNIGSENVRVWLWSMPFFVLATAAVFFCFHLYHSVWSYVGIVELRNLVISYGARFPVYCAIAWVLWLILGARMPYSCYIMGFVLSFCGCVAVRFGYRFLRYVTNETSQSRTSENVMIIGAGAAAQVIVRELQTSDHYHSRIRCIIDDNPTKQGRYFHGIVIAGDRYEINKAVSKYNIHRIIFAIPSCPAEEKKKILHLCKETRCKLQTLPGLYELQNSEVSTRQLRDVNVEDLLGREPIRVDTHESTEAISGKVVLVTGGGGSIGSELCRQIAKAKPKKLIIFDIYENNAYEIQQELRRSEPNLDLEVLIGSVRNTSRIHFVIEKYRPQLVFHAAAHKHVPLMEDSPNEAIKNNVFGTYKTALAAAKYGVEKFVLISTDKAVNPTNIMGASKRLCEMVVQMMSRAGSKTCFSAVRFGNVLGSNGSVIPLFKKQIAAGGPVTITDKRIIRYFMTISEAVSLVLQASYFAKGGEIFVLDMGDPVKIDDMARNLIQLSGFRPDVDIKIEYTGLRPGEKLFEELLMDEEGLKETDNKLIHIGQPIEMDDADFVKKLMELDEASREETGRIRTLVSEMVPTYHPKEENKA